MGRKSGLCVFLLIFDLMNQEKCLRELTLVPDIDSRWCNGSWLVADG
jgi:hypothetical protein